jgi:hypothetical protein
MSCREREHDIVLYLYEELPEGDSRDLRVHMNECAPCQDFYENERALHFKLTDDFSDWEVPSDLLVESRRALSDELDRIDTKRAWWRFPSLAPVFSRMRLLESAALVSIGLAVGVYVMAQNPAPTVSVPQQVQVAPIPQNATVSNLRIVEANPSTGQIQLAGEMVQPMKLQGNLRDEDVRRLLFGGLRSPNNPGFRLQTVELLAQSSRDPSIKEVLIGTLLNDENAGIRLYALEGLKAFAMEDDVRRALVYALENDQNAGIRVEAIEALTSSAEAEIDESMGQIIQDATREDENAYVRMKALQFVGAGRQ